MSTSYTANCKMQEPATADRNWDVPLNANTAFLDAVASIGWMIVSPHEIPSTTLNVAVSAGLFVNAAGQVVTYAGSASFAMTTASTNYVFLTDAGVLTANTSAFSAGNIVRLATVVAGATTITSITDARLPFSSRGQTGQVLPAPAAVVTTPFTISVANAVTLVNVGSASVANLPAASTIPAGTVLRIKDVSGAAGSNNITITRAGSDTIDGATTLVIATNYGKAVLWCDGTSKWYTI